MLERLLELSIYVLGGLIALILGWAIVRNVLISIETTREKKRNETIRTLLEKWLNNVNHRKEIVQEIKKLNSVSHLEPLFFEMFETVSLEEHQELKILFELLGIQEFLRKILKESSDVSKREKAVLKLAKIGIVEDIPFLLEVFRDPEEEDRVKKCCTQAIYELSDKLICDEKAISNLGLLVQLLDLPNIQLQEYIAQHLAKLPVAIEDIVPHLLRLETQTAKEGILIVFQHWNNAEHAPLLYDYLDDTSPVIRQKTIELIGKWQDEKSIVVLLNKLEDPSERVRLAAIDALSYLNQPALLQKLRHCLQDPSTVIQIKLYFLLSELKDHESFDELIQKIQDLEFRKILNIELSHMSKQKLVHFLEFLGIDHHIYSENKSGDFFEAFVSTARESLSSELRQRALSALSMWKKEKGIAIISEIAKSDPDPVNRLYAVKLLEMFSKKEVSHG